MTYDVILADPPWTFRVWNAAKVSRHTSHKYDLMSVEEICALPVGDVAGKNAALFLWATWPNLEDAMRVIPAWGFDYRSLAWVWVKAKKNGTGFHFGLGYYTRANSEPCLLAIKGRMPVVAKDVMALIYSQVRQHSRKPDEQYGKIERLYPGRRYVELFARERRLGWDSVGGAIDGRDIRNVLEDMKGETA